MDYGNIATSSFNKSNDNGIKIKELEICGFNIFINIIKQKYDLIKKNTNIFYAFSYNLLISYGQIMFFLVFPKIIIIIFSINQKKC